MLSIDFKAKCKWDAWDSKQGVPREEAKYCYILLVKELGVIV